MTPLLLVTQESWLRNFVKKHTEGLGVKILKECETTKQALDIYSSEKPQLVVIDMFLKGVTGLELLKSLRKAQDDQIILLIARMRNHSVLEKSFRYGANDVLEFPPDGRIFRNIMLQRLEEIENKNTAYF